MNKNEVIVLRCDYEFKKYLEDKAEAAGESQSEFIRQCIKGDDYLEQELIQTAINPEHQKYIDSTISHLKNAQDKASQMDEAPKQLMNELNKLVKKFELLRSKKRQKQDCIYMFQLINRELTVYTKKWQYNVDLF